MGEKTMEVKIFVRKTQESAEERLVISVGNQAIAVNCSQQYAPKTKRYIVDQIAKRFIPDNFVSVNIQVDSHAILKAIPVSQPTGEDTTVIQTYSESGYIADEYIFIDEKCVFCNDEDIADGITMGALVREYVEDVFFGKK